MSANNGHVISQRDRADLEAIEVKMAQGMKDVAEGLVSIHRRKLYLIHYDTFEEYCEQRLKRSRTWAYDQMQLEDVRTSLPPEMSEILDTDSSVRELAKVPKKRRMRVIERVLAEEKDITPQAIKTAARQELKPAPPMPPEPIDVKEVVYDATGYEVPEHLVEFYQQGKELGKDLTNRVSSIRGALRRVEGTNDPKYAFISVSSVMSLLNNLYGELTQLTPHAVCPYCQGQVRSHCTVCRKTGFLPKHQWDHAVPSDLKAVREKGLKKKG